MLLQAWLLSQHGPLQMLLHPSVSWWRAAHQGLPGDKLHSPLVGQCSLWLWFFFPTPVGLLYGKFICVYSMGACHCHCVSGCAPWRTVFSAQADIRLTDIGGDSSTVAYGNRLLTAKTWHQRKQVSQAWHSVLLRGLRDRLSAYSGIITPITSTLIPDKGEGSKTKYTGWCWLQWNWWQVTQKRWWISHKKSIGVVPWRSSDRDLSIL